MKISEIVEGGDTGKVIEFLKGLQKKVDIKGLKSQYNADEHEIFDKALRPDKTIKIDNEGGKRIEKVNRIGLPLQKRIVNSSVSFTFGNPVNIVCQPEKGQQEEVLSAIKKILEGNKIDSFNRKVGRELYRSTEVAEIWFARPETERHSTYGFETSFKVKALICSSWNGDLLCPYFNEFGDMVAFGRGYEVVRENITTEHFDIYTDEEIGVFKKAQDGGQWEGVPVANTIKKIPVIYTTEEQADWEDVQKCINRLEKILSNFGDTNDYFGSPMIFIEGEITGLPNKGEPGKILQGDPGSKASYLSWQHAPESVKLEIETLFKVIYSLTQTPDISFENLKDLNQISGVALKMLFMDAHLKVQEKREVLDEYLQRRMNVLKAFVAQLNTGLKQACETIEIRSEIVPFIIDDLASQIENLITANGGKPIISQKTSVSKSGLTQNPDDEWKQIEEEKVQSMNESVIP